MNKQVKYLNATPSLIFAALEDSIQKGYSIRNQLFKEHDTLRNKGTEVTQVHRDLWHKLYADWVNETHNRLVGMFHYTNYANEFVSAPRMKPSYGRQNEDGIFTSIVDNQLYMIQKLEELRSRIWEKSSIVINNSGQLALQVGNNNTNEQTK